VIRVLAAAIALGAALGASAQQDQAREAQRRGAELHRSGDLEGALREFEQVVRLAPQAPLGWYNRGLVKRDLKDCRGAIADFSRALELEPAHFNSLYQRGRCRQALGDDSGALPDLTRAAAQPGQVHARFMAYFARADAYRRLGRLDEAHADYTYVLELRTDTTARRSRGWVSLYRGRLREAADDFIRYMHDTEGKEPDAPYATIAAVLALRRLRQGDEAAKLLERWTPRLNAKAWPAPVLEFLRGNLAEERLIASASGAGQKTEALAYAGMAALADGGAERGYRLLRRVLREGDPAYLEYDLAYYELRGAGRATPADRKERKTK
jgi:tetratricopeptide (TPR) repeat protein